MWPDLKNGQISAGAEFDVRCNHTSE